MQQGTKMKNKKLYSTWDYIEEYSNLVDTLWEQHALTHGHSQKLQIEDRIFNILQGINILESK